MRYGVAGLLLIGMTLVSVAHAASPAAPSHLRVNDAVNPVGTGAAPFFGWHVNDPDENEIQTAYQIQVAANDDFSGALLWDSGKTESRKQNHIAYNGSALTADTVCFWRVKTWDRKCNEGRWSDANRFAVGLLENTDWGGAHWIRRDSSDADDYTYYRKTVVLSAKPVQRATIYISGVHKYALHVNGTLAGKGPAYHYPQYQYYNAYDVTDLLAEGKPNVFAIFNHWFGGGQGRPQSARGVIMKAIIHFNDGTCTVIGTDDTWQQSRAKAWATNQPHRNRGEGVGYVEKIDARMLVPEWKSPAFDDSKWEAVTVIGAHPVKPWSGTLAPDLTRIMEREIEPAEIITKQEGTYLVDLGKVYAGVPRIRFSGGGAGETVRMLGGYGIDAGGDIDTAMNQSTDMRFEAVLSGGEFIYEPAEYLGMRYLAIENAPMPVTKDNFTFVVRHSEMNGAASAFESSDTMLNAVWALMKHSLYTCAQEEFVDTPTREKGGFLGDAAIQSTVAMPVMNERRLTRRVLGEFLQSMEQHWPGQGRMNAVYPNNDGARDIPDYTQAYLVWAWDYYMETGDRAFLSENYESLKSIADYVHRHEDQNTGLVTDLSGGSGPYQYGIVDWPATMRYGYDMTTVRTVINGWAFADYTVVSDIAEVLGETEDVETYRMHAEHLKQSINNALINSTGAYVDGLGSNGSKSAHVSQHANMYPLALGIVPEARKATVIKEVKNQQMSVGMVSLPWLIRAIGEAEEGEHLIELFTNEAWNGWAQSLSRGATATWESWDADSAGQSLSHAWGAAGLEGYVRYILGIRPLKPQYEEVLIKPLDCGSMLDWAKGSITTDRGSISVSWKQSANVFDMELALPINVLARVAVPKGRSSGATLYIDGEPVQGTVEGDYVVVRNLGSGQHRVIRK